MSETGARETLYTQRQYPDMLREFPLAISKGRWLAETAALAALYFGTARLGQLLAIPPGNVTALWPPSGLALAAFLLLGPRAGLGVFIGAYLASIWTLFDGSNLAALFVSNTAVLMIALGSTLQALTGAFLIRTRLRTNDPFEKAYDVLGFAVIESLCCLIAPTLGVSSLGMSGYVALSACGTTWWTWWLGDFIGILVVTPLVVTWWSRPLRPVGVRRLGEALALLLLLAAVNELVFGSFGLGLPLVPATYLVAPLVIWAAIRFGPPGAALLGILGAILAVLGTVHGRGRYAGVPLENALLLIDGYIGVFALTGAVLAAAVLEKKTAQRGLQQANDELEMRVRDRTADLDRALNNMKREHIERQCAEQALWESEKSLRLRNRIAEICLTASDADMYAGILQVNLEVTQSQYGVFGYLDERGALVVPTMTRHIWEQCRIPDKDIVFPREKWGESIWPRAIHQKQTLYSNEPSTRAPQGHVAIRRNISVPIMHRGEAIGLFQVANKETDYDSNDLQNLENIGQYIAPLLAARLQRNREETARLRAEEELRTLNAELERRVRERTAQLAAANEELESFCYSVSHDLRAPLRAIDGFSRILVEDFAAHLPEEALGHLGMARQNAQRMGRLIDDLLTFSRLGRQVLHRRRIDLAALARQVLEELCAAEPQRQIEVRVAELPACHADPALLRQVLVNLLQNALKYTRRRAVAWIEVGYREKVTDSHQPVFYVKDNGVGFDMQYAHKLFGVFQRLHRAEDYEGTGVGLALVQRIVHRHGGRVWAESSVDQGATFYFTLKGDPESHSPPAGEGLAGEANGMNSVREHKQGGTP